MYPTSKNYKKTVVKSNRVWALDGHIYTDAGQDIAITENDIVQGSLVFKEGCTCVDTIQTGSTYANSLDFSLINNEQQFNAYNFEHARVSMRVGLQISTPPTFAMRPLVAGIIPVNFEMSEDAEVEVHIPLIEEGSNAYLIRNQNHPEAVYVKTQDTNLEIVAGELSTLIPVEDVQEGIIVTFTNGRILVTTHDSHIVLYDEVPQNKLIYPQDKLVLFDELNTTTCGIGFLRIDAQLEWWGVQSSSMYFSNTPAPYNCFWDEATQQYVAPARELLAITSHEEQVSFEYIPLGIFNVTTAGKKLSSIPINCLDNMYKLNVALSSLNLTFPLNLLALFDLICVGCGLQSAASLRNELAALNLTINPFEQKDYTCRDIVGYMGVLIGKNIQVGRDGLLDAFWYSSNSQSTDARTRVGNSSYEDLMVIIDGVIITDWEGNTYLVGEENQVAEYDVNPLIQSEEVAQAVASITLSRLNAVAYHPCTVTYVGDPSWQAGDIVEHIRDNDNNILAPLMLHSYKFRGTGTLETKGVTPEQNRQLTASAKKLLKVQTQTKQDLNKGLGNMQQTILNQSQLITEALGFWPHIEYNDDGSIKGYYLMSTPTDTDTTTVWAFTSGGIGVSHTGIAGPYSSSWTSDDTIVAHVITADMIRTGMLAALDDLLTIDLSNGLFKTVSSKGSTTIDGNEVTAQYWNSHVDTKPPVAYIKISADESDSTNYIASMRIVFASNDGQTYAYIGQDLTHEAQTSRVTEIGQLVISHSLPIKIANSLEVVDSIVYDRIKMQRKNQEEGNTGIDFVSIS